ncbi:hypothetical protein CAEBREN_05555 [Caenorhabditis brenneri]|uniref:Transmembrane protein n=1 Tax=Caenorhabditis brenneri TaxID=135651 RepID=G0P9X4_CAEBE|nr:hypothetical protein CAEBREN_05555 [Caenorhabditis brenneri]
MNFIPHSAEPSNEPCHLHPVQHKGFSFKENSETNGNLSNVQHHVTVCHQLQWSHYTFWDNMYLILLPAITCFCLILYTICEIMEFDQFVGTVQSTALVILSVLSVIYTVAVITHEKYRIKDEWEILKQAESLGANSEEITVDVPKTWQYSIAMCLLSALFKCGRILIQHFIGDKKFFLDDDTLKTDKTTREPILRYGNNLNVDGDDGEVAGTTRMLNESRYSRLKCDD